MNKTCYNKPLDNENLCSLDSSIKWGKEQILFKVYFEHNPFIQHTYTILYFCITLKPVVNLQ